MRSLSKSNNKIILISVLTCTYVICSFILIRNYLHTSPFMYALFSLFLLLYTVFLWVIENGKKSLTEIKDHKKLFILYVFLIIFSILETHSIFLLKNIYDPFTRYFSFVQPVVVASLFLIFYSIFFWKLKYKNIFLITNIVFGSFMMLVISPGSVPDEPAHIQTSYYVSNRIMGISQNNYYVMRKDDARVASNNYSTESYHYLDTYNNYLHELRAPLKDGTLVNYDLNLNEGLKNNAYLYILSGLGISLGRILSLGTFETLLLGRLFNFIFYTILIYLSFDILPVGKTLLLVLTVLPMTLQESMSFSYDSPIIALSVISISTSLRTFYNKDDIKLKDYIIAVLLFLILFKAKSHAYFLVGFLPLCSILLTKLDKKITLNNRKIFKIIFWVVVVFGVLFYCIWFFSGKAADFTYTPSMVTRNGSINPPVEGFSVGYAIKNPYVVLCLIWNTLHKNLYLYGKELIGADLGWLNLHISDLYIYVMSICLLFSALRRDNETIEGLKKINWSMYFWIDLLTICFIFAGMAMAWTLTTETEIQGVQGRYFIPIALSLFLFLKKCSLTVNENAEKKFVFFVLFLSAYILESLVMFM